MAAYTDSLGFNKGTAAFPADVTSVSKFLVELDFAAIIAARSAAGATALAATDTLQVISLPAYSVVLTAGLNVVTAETVNTTATFDLGFTGGSPAAANVYCDDAASNAVAMDSDNLANPTVIKTADTIDLLLNTAAPTNCVIQVWAIVADCSSV
jgi:hypothetical protein